MKTPSHSLATFIRRTETLHKNLQALMKRYPEDALEPDDRIFNRLLTNAWRRWLNDVYGPAEQRYADAAKWVDELNCYDLELREFCVYTLGWTTKLNELPMHAKLPFSAAQCLHQLKLQLQVLKRWECEATNSMTAGPIARLRADLQGLIATKGRKTVEAEVNVNTDTLRDFINGKTKPQQKTVDTIGRYVKQQKSLD